MTARRSARLQWWRSWRLRSAGGAGRWKGWSVGAVLAGGAAGGGSVDDRAGAGAGESGGRQSSRPLPLPLLVSGAVPAGAGGGLGHDCADALVACHRLHAAVSMFLMALRAVGSEEMPRTRRAS